MNNHLEIDQNSAIRNPQSVLVVVALGSNLGDSRQIVLQAMDRLQSLSDRPLLRSSLWETSPVDCPPDSPDFVNAVTALIPRADEIPETLLVKLQTLEKEFGRKTKMILNEPRPVDLDLIAFGQECRISDHLTLPHPRAHVRRFVLQPLAEIAPAFVLPGQSLTVAQLLARLANDESVARLDAGSVVPSGEP
jgi:2-amino-4-hydroxy-6-hydroxymethyldihydropteridine diphosphokinase